MKIAYIMASGKGDTDLLLSSIANSLCAKGRRVCGTAQTNTECEGGGPCDMDVKVLPSGPVIRISQSLGLASKGCRLDPSALEYAVGLVEGELEEGAALLIINKFGKHEADGRGFRSAIAAAIGRDVPVLVGLNALNKDAFDEFTGGETTHLPASQAAIQEWCENILQ